MFDSLLPADERCLLQVAARAIAAVCRDPGRGPWTVRLEEFSPSLREDRATFVTLHHRNDLRGCRGSLTANEPLVANVARSAQAAAFADYRFPPVTADELFELHLHISILSPFQPLDFSNEDELVIQLRPGIDGIVLSQHPHHGVFLPSVWEKVPEPREFLKHLKHKAGLPLDYWSAALRAERFTVESVAGTLPDLLNFCEVTSYNSPVGVPSVSFPGES